MNRNNGATELKLLGLKGPLEVPEFNLPHQF